MPGIVLGARDIAVTGKTGSWLQEANVFSLLTLFCSALCIVVVSETAAPSVGSPEWLHMESLWGIYTEG